MIKQIHILSSQMGTPLGARPAGLPRFVVLPEHMFDLDLGRKQAGNSENRNTLNLSLYGR